MPLKLEITLGPGIAAPADGRAAVLAPAAATWPFLHPLSADLPAGAAAILVPALHEAFVNRQPQGSRLVTTQPAFLLLAWADLVGDGDVVMRASADRDALAQFAPEILERRGVFAGDAITVEITDGAAAADPPVPPSVPAPAAPLVDAFRAATAEERLRSCIRALDIERSPAALVATASVCMEVNDLEAAGRDLDAALALAPEWGAAHYERGKLWLRLDDMEQASAAFRAAAERLPRFAPAWANLGATLGELDRPLEAREAFTHALACDPSNPQTHNNIGVVSRELGALADAEAAFRRVIALVPQLAFGYYNLGHTLFLAGRYQAALGAYLEGQKRDPERNAVQASRLAICRLATGDAGGALRELQQATAALPRDYRQQLLADTQSIVLALVTTRPDLAGWPEVSEWLTRELAR